MAKKKQVETSVEEVKKDEKIIDTERDENAAVESAPKLESEVATQVKEVDTPVSADLDTRLPDLGIEEDDESLPPAVGESGSEEWQGAEQEDTGGETLTAQPAEEAALQGVGAHNNRPRLLKDRNLRELDRYLTPEEKTEWNAIYASYRSRSILTGTVTGIDHNTFEVEDRVTGKTTTKNVYSAVIINYRVKVLIPESEMWAEDAQWAGHVLRSMTGAKLEYVIIDLDRENGIAIASRRLALPARRRYFNTAPQGHKVGERLDCQVLATGTVRCVVTCNGYDCSLDQTNMTYSTVYDLRQQYRAGQEMTCILTKYENGNIKISVKDATANPFDGVEFRHPIAARREATITGKYIGGVFVTLGDGLTILCNYSRMLCDEDFQEGDKIMVAIERFNFEKKQVYGRIMGKLW